MTSTELHKLNQLNQACVEVLADRGQQSMQIWRGEMRAIVAAVREIARLNAELEKQRRAS